MRMVGVHACMHRCGNIFAARPGSEMQKSNSNDVVMASRDFLLTCVHKGHCKCGEPSARHHNSKWNLKKRKAAGQERLGQQS